MENLTLVKIRNPQNYQMLKNKGTVYGILVSSREHSAIINFDSNMGGLAINISHCDYGVVSPNYWDILDGEIVITCCGGYIPTGLKVWT
jgi:hypothetical protein